MQNRPLRIGLVGCGEVCEQIHAPALLRLGDVRVTALADHTVQRAEHIALRFGGQPVFADAKSLIGAGVVDVVGVLTLPQSHRRIAEQAMKAGLHILLEKPAGLSLADADALVAAAHRYKVYAVMGFPLRWHRLVRRARQRVAHAGLGVIESVRSTWSSPLEDDGLPAWKSRRVEGGGVLFETAAHLFDLWRYLLDAEIEEVFAWTRSGVREDESAGVMATLTGGVVAVAQMSGSTAHDIEFELCGTQGRLRVSGQRFDGYEWFERLETPGMVAPRLRGLKNFVRDLPIGVAGMGRSGDYGNAYRDMWSHLKRIALVRSTRLWYSCGAGGGHGRVLDGPTTPGAARCGRGVAVGRTRREVLRQSRVGRSAEAAAARNRRGGAPQANPLAPADPPRPAHGAGGPDPRAAGSPAGRMTGGPAHAGESPHAVPHDQTARRPV